MADVPESKSSPWMIFNGYTKAVLVTALLSGASGAGGVTLFSGGGKELEVVEKRIEAVETLLANTAQAVMQRTEAVAQVAAFREQLNGLAEAQRQTQSDVREIRNMLLKTSP